MRFFQAVTVSLLACTQVFASTAYRRILIEKSAHPAIHSAAKILAHNLQLPDRNIESVAKLPSPREGDILLTVDPHAAENDGYRITFENNSAVVAGARPRSLLYAAGDVRLWSENTSGTFLRQPSFGMRIGQYDSNRTVPEYVAELGVNGLILPQNGAVVTLKDTLPEVFKQLDAADKARLERGREASYKRNHDFARECRDADVPFYSFLYGNDVTRWSKPLYESGLKVYPSMKGTRPRTRGKRAICARRIRTPGNLFARTFKTSWIRRAPMDSTRPFGMRTESTAMTIAAGAMDWIISRTKSTKTSRLITTSSMRRAKSSSFERGLPARRTGSAINMSMLRGMAASAVPAKSSGAESFAICPPIS